MLLMFALQQPVMELRGMRVDRNVLKQTAQTLKVVLCAFLM